MPTKPLPPELREAWDKHRQCDKLGRGGLGEVAKILHCREGQNACSYYALKHVPKHLPDGTQPLHERERHGCELIMKAYRERPQEVQNVLQVLDLYESDDALWVLIELAEMPLRKHVDHLKNLGPSAASGVLRRLASVSAVKQIAFGLRTLHDLGLVHRDVKPDNILVMQTDPLRIKVGDFSLTKHEASVDTFSGTPLYQPPELGDKNRYRNPRNGPFDARKQDAWGLGVVAAEIVLGPRPYSHVADPGPRPASRSQPYSDHEMASLDRFAPHLGEAVAGCLKRDPASRWSVKQFADAMERIEALVLRGGLPPPPEPGYIPPAHDRFDMSGLSDSLPSPGAARQRSAAGAGPTAPPFAGQPPAPVPVALPCGCKRPPPPILSREYFEGKQVVITGLLDGGRTTQASAKQFLENTCNALKALKDQRRIPKEATILVLGTTRGEQGKNEVMMDAESDRNKDRLQIVCDACFVKLVNAYTAPRELDREFEGA